MRVVVVLDLTDAQHEIYKALPESIRRRIWQDAADEVTPEPDIYWDGMSSTHAVTHRVTADGEHYVQYAAIPEGWQSEERVNQNPLVVGGKAWLVDHPARKPATIVSMAPFWVQLENEDGVRGDVNRPLVSADPR